MFVAILSSISAVTAPVLAGVLVENSLAGTNDSSATGLVLLDPTSGSHLVVTGQTDWDSGTYTMTDADTASGGDLTLDHYGDIPGNNVNPIWWNTGWTDRRCVTITNSGPPRQTAPVEIVLDTTAIVANNEMDPTGADIRAVDSSTGLEVPLWIESGPGTTDTEIWVQVPNLIGGDSEICLYSGNATATTVSDEQAVFTYATQSARYYTLSDRWTGQTLSVTSYVDGNSITAAGITQVADRGDVVTFPNANKDTVIAATGPISGSSTANPTDSIMPEAYASNQFIFSINRNQQIIWVRAPLGPVTLEFQAGGAVIDTTIWGAPGPPAPAATQTINPGDGAVGILADAANNEGVLVRSLGGQDFVAMHDARHNNGVSGTDAAIGVPWLGESIYGVRSRYLLVTAGTTAAAYSAIGSDGTVINNAAVGATEMDTTSTSFGPVSLDRRGQGPAMVVTSSGPVIAATQYADENGSEITNFFPYSLLEREYFTSTPANYLAIACPIVGQQVTVTEPGGAVTNLTCTNPGGVAGAPGKAYIGIRAIAAGTHIESPDRFFLYYEKSAGSDEINVTGAKASIYPASQAPAVALGPLEGLYKPSGSWVGVFDTGTSGVYGILDMLGNLPAGTTATLQISTGATAAAATAAPLVGPDGTAGTFYTFGSDLINTIHDFDQFVQIEIQLTTSDPLVTPVVTEVDISTDLTQWATSDLAETTIPITAGPGLDTHIAARIYSTGTLSFTTDIVYDNGTGLPAADLVTVRTDHPADHVRALAGAIVQGQGAPFALTPADTFTLLIDEDIQAGNTVTIDVTITAVEANGVIVEHDVHFVLTS